MENTGYEVRNLAKPRNVVSHYTKTFEQKIKSTTIHEEILSQGNYEPQLAKITEKNKSRTIL
jgi:hypothetical protein